MIDEFRLASLAIQRLGEMSFVKARRSARINPESVRARKEYLIPFEVIFW